MSGYRSVHSASALLWVREIVSAVQVYASITPVMCLVNVGRESGGVRSLAGVWGGVWIYLMSIQPRYWSRGRFSLSYRHGRSRCLFFLGRACSWWVDTWYSWSLCIRLKDTAFGCSHWSFLRMAVSFWFKRMPNVGPGCEGTNVTNNRPEGLPALYKTASLIFDANCPIGNFLSLL